MRPLLLCSLLMSLFTSCNTSSTAQSATELKDQPGKIVVHHCGRGCSNYLIETQIAGNTVRLFPEQLADNFHEEGKTFTFNGVLLAEYEQLVKPGADDRSLPDEKVQKVRILSAKE